MDDFNGGQNFVSCMKFGQIGTIVTNENKCMIVNSKGETVTIVA